MGSNFNIFSQVDIKTHFLTHSVASSAAPETVVVIRDANEGPIDKGPRIFETIVNKAPSHGEIFANY